MASDLSREDIKRRHRAAGPASNRIDQAVGRVWAGHYANDVGSLLDALDASEAENAALRSRYDEAVELLRETFDGFDGENLTYEYAYYAMKNARHRVAAFLAKDTATQGAEED